MLLQHMAEAHAVSKASDHPAVRLIFDTSHVQLADHPGRAEPGCGEIDFESLLRFLHPKGYRAW